MASEQATTSPVAWKTGQSLAHELRLPVDINWSDIPLRQAIERLSLSRSVAVFLDRRVDPDQRIEMDATNVPLQAVMGRLAENRESEMGWIGPVAYIGPRGTAVRLRLLLDDADSLIARLPDVQRKLLQRRRPLRWDELAVPNELLVALASSYGIDLQGRQQLTHDLWPSVNLPPLDFAESMTLITYGFGLTFQLSKTGSAVRLVPLPERIVSARGSSTENEGPLKVSDPASVEDLDNKRFTLAYEGHPAGRLVELLVRKYGLQLELSPDAQARLENIVSISVKEVTFDQLLKETLGPLELRYELQGRTLSIRGTAP